eukprot:TRINITY_DN33349_c0_g1_i1.p1 TRINITY_DN33349_c0_g1~~TRINITY_DN33349_c0_g1_i1.p1  ORF type:complete len:379 (-),score=30.59 TRINITY_DN33349_c0_g1_i1:17-1153(-)
MKASRAMGVAAAMAAVYIYWKRRRSKPRSSYLNAAERDPRTFLCNRGHMLAFYEADIDNLLPHSICVQVPARAANTTYVGVLQWNLNVLMGMDGRHPVSVADVVDVILRSKADVVLLQEAGVQTFEEDTRLGYTKYYEQPLDRLNGRIVALHDSLKQHGFVIVAAADGMSENPSLLATRLKICDVGGTFPIDGQFGRWTYGDSRSGRVVNLELPQAPEHSHAPSTLAVLITHLHHTESGELRGVRGAEVTALLEKWREAVSRSPSNVATVLATDMNSARQQDYNSREWAVIRAGCAKLGQPTYDGVSGMLSSAGFTCVYDKAPSGPPPMTHWTGTVVDFPWCHFQRPEDWTIRSVKVLPTKLSDHLPVHTELGYARVR